MGADDHIADFRLWVCPHHGIVGAREVPAKPGVYERHLCCAECGMAMVLAPRKGGE